MPISFREELAYVRKKMAFRQRMVSMIAMCKQVVAYFSLSFTMYDAGWAHKNEKNYYRSEERHQAFG